MLSEQVELGLADVDLGALSEVACLSKMGDVHAHALTAGTGMTLRELVDGQGAPLYPGYFHTHLRWPATAPTMRVWDRVRIGVAVQRFGPTLLSSRYVLDREGATLEPPGPAAITMSAASMFYRSDGSPAAPVAACLAPDLPRVATAPEALARFREQRARTVLDLPRAALRHRAPLSYTLVLERDLRAGYGVMFARWSLFSDVFEHALFEHAGAPPGLVERLELSEREAFYFANVRGAGELHGRVAGAFERPEPDEDPKIAGWWRATVEIFDERDTRLWAGLVRKRVVVDGEQSTVADLRTWMENHGQ